MLIIFHFWFMGNSYYYHLFAIIFTILKLLDMIKMYNYHHVIKSYCRVMFRNTFKGLSKGREKLRKFIRKASTECIMCMCSYCNLQWVMRWTTVKRCLTVFKHHDRRTAVQKLSLLADPYTVRTTCRYQLVKNMSLPAGWMLLMT